jgi:hypothetical protein
MKNFRIALAIFAVVVLAGCGNAGSVEKNSTRLNHGVYGGMQAFLVDTPDGRTVTCVVYDGNRAGGVSCDWASAK